MSFSHVVVRLPPNVRVGQLVRLPGRAKSSVGKSAGDVYVLICDQYGRSVRQGEEYLVDRINNARGFARGDDPIFSAKGVVLSATSRVTDLSRGDLLMVGFYAGSLSFQAPNDQELTITHGELKSMQMGGKGEYFFGPDGESPRFVGPFGAAANSSMKLEKYLEVDVTLELTAARMEIRLQNVTAASLGQALADWMYDYENVHYPSVGSPEDRSLVCGGAGVLLTSSRGREELMARYDRIHGMR